MTTALVAYASHHGHTGRVADRLAAALRERDLQVALIDLEHDDPSPRGLDGVVVLAGIHGGHAHKSALRWCRRHHARLALVPSAFAGVSLMAAEDSESARSAVRSYLDDLVEQTGWTPGIDFAIAGALQYREYDPFTRLVMRTIAGRHGGAQDTSHDHVLTDWEQVDAIAGELAAAFARSAVATGA